MFKLYWADRENKIDKSMKQKVCMNKSFDQ